MSQSGSQTIEQATTAIQVDAQPDNKTRRYDRQLRLWAASGQAALESSRILVISATATSTSILKNLVLPGIGHFTILDPNNVSAADAGNNFFLNGYSSIGKSRAEEAVPLLKELNDSVDGEAVVKRVEDLLKTDDGKQWIKNFTLVIAHNLPNGPLETLSDLLWEELEDPPLMIVRSAGFLADFYIQFREQCIIESHTETAPSIRLTKPFPALQEWADNLDYSKVDPTEHAHIPFAIILIKEADQWRVEHDGALPNTYDEKAQFKKRIRERVVKIDEENFEEAETQAVRLWSEKGVPSDIEELFSLEPLASSSSKQMLNPEFHALLKTLHAFVNSPEGPGNLPLSSTLPDMKTDTESYVKLQRMYKAQSAIEATQFKELLASKYPQLTIDEDMVDSFIKHAHQIKVLRGKKYGALEANKDAISAALQAWPSDTATTHFALNALSILLEKNSDPTTITAETLKSEVENFVGQGVDIPEDLDNAAGELARSPTADLPNTAAFLGGMIAQEAIKMITKQYVPVNGWCVVDLIESKTGIVNN